MTPEKAIRKRTMKKIGDNLFQVIDEWDINHPDCPLVIIGDPKIIIDNLDAAPSSAGINQ
jgi:hypothetical protein